MDLDRLISRLKAEESFSPCSFWDDAPGGGGGQWSWGYGSKAPGPDCTISEEQAEGELREKVQDAHLILRGGISEIT